MFGRKPMVWMLCLLLAAAPLAAQETPLQDYARRETDSRGLEDFRGGFHLVVAGIILVCLVTTAICLDWAACPGCSRRHHYHELPPAVDRHGHVRP